MTDHTPTRTHLTLSSEKTEKESLANIGNLRPAPTKTPSPVPSDPKTGNAPSPSTGSGGKDK